MNCNSLNKVLDELKKEGVEFRNGEYIIPQHLKNSVQDYIKSIQNYADGAYKLPISKTLLSIQKSRNSKNIGYDVLKINHSNFNALNKLIQNPMDISKFGMNNLKSSNINQDSEYYEDLENKVKTRDYIMEYGSEYGDFAEDFFDFIKEDRKNIIKDLTEEIYESYQSFSPEEEDSAEDVLKKLSRFIKTENVKANIGSTASSEGSGVKGSGNAENIGSTKPSTPSTQNEESSEEDSEEDFDDDDEFGNIDPDFNFSSEPEVNEEVDITDNSDVNDNINENTEEPENIDEEDDSPYSELKDGLTEEDLNMEDLDEEHENLPEYNPNNIITSNPQNVGMAYASSEQYGNVGMGYALDPSQMQTFVERVAYEFDENFQVQINGDGVDKFNVPMTNAYSKMYLYKKSIYDRGQRTLLSLINEIKVTKNIEKRKELIGQAKSLKDYLEGNSIRKGLKQDIEDLNVLSKNFDSVLNKRDRLLNELKEYIKEGGYESGKIDTLSKEVSQLNSILYREGYHNFENNLRESFKIDIERVKEVAKTDTLEGFIQVYDIINFYQNLNPFKGGTNESNNFNPLFEEEELDFFGQEIDVVDSQENKVEVSNTLLNLQNISQEIDREKNLINTKIRNIIIDYARSLEVIGKKIPEDTNKAIEYIFKIKNGLHDVNTVDLFTMAMNRSIVTGEGKQSVLAELLKEIINENINDVEAERIAIEDGLDEVVDEVNRKLVEAESIAGIPTVDNTSILGRAFSRQRPRFDIFKKVSKNGVTLPRLRTFQRDAYDDAIREAKNSYARKVRKEFYVAKKSNKEPDVVKINRIKRVYHNKLRETSETLNPVMFRELWDPNDLDMSFIFKSFGISEPDMSETENYKQYIVTRFGENIYNDFVQKVREATINFSIEKEQSIKNLARNTGQLTKDFNERYKKIVEEGGDVYDLIQGYEEEKDIIREWERTHNPFMIAEEFDNDYANVDSNKYGVNLDYTVFIPRDTRLEIRKNKDGEYTFKDTGERLIDEVYVRLKNDEHFGKYLDLMHKASDFNKQALYNTPAFNSHKEGSLPLSEDHLMQEFTYSSNFEQDTFLSAMSKKFKDILKNIFNDYLSTPENTEYKGIRSYGSRDIVKEINTSQLNVTEKNIRDNIYNLKVIEYKAYNEGNDDFKKVSKKINYNSEILFSFIPPHFLKEAMFLAGHKNPEIFKMLDKKNLEKEFKNFFKMNPKANTINIFGLLEDLHRADADKESSKDLSFIMRKSMSRASAIIGRQRAKPLVEEVFKKLKAIKKIQTNNQGGVVSDETGVVTDSERKNAIKQAESYLNQVLYLSSQTPDKEILITEDADSQVLRKKEWKFLTRIAGSRKKIAHIDKILNEHPNLSLSDRLTLLKLRDRNLKYLGLKTTIGNPALSYIRFSALSWKALTQFNNLQQGMSALFEEDARGRYWDRGTMYKTYPIIRGMMMRNATQFSDTLDKKLTPNARKANNIINRLNIIQDATSLENKALNRDKTKGAAQQFLSPYALVQKVEYINQGSVILNILMSEKIKDVDGKEISVWDALDENGKLDPERYSPEDVETYSNLKGKKYNNLRGRIMEAHKSTAGNYSELDPTFEGNHFASKSLSQLKRWMPELIRNYYGSEELNYKTGLKEKGVMRSFTVGELAIQRLLMIGSKGSSLQLNGVLKEIALLVMDSIVYYKTPKEKRTRGLLFDKHSLTIAKALSIGIARNMLAFPVNIAGGFVGKPNIINAESEALSNMLKNSGLNDLDVGNVFVMSRLLGKHMMILGMYILLSQLLRLAEDEEEEEYKFMVSPLTIAVNLASTMIEDGMFFTRASEPEEIYKKVVSPAYMRTFEKAGKYFKTVGKVYSKNPSDWRMSDAQKLGGGFVDTFVPLPGRDFQSYSSKVFNEYGIVKSIVGENSEEINKTYSTERKGLIDAAHSDIVDISKKYLEDNNVSSIKELNEKNFSEYQSLVSELQDEVYGKYGLNVDSEKLKNISEESSLKSNFTQSINKILPDNSKSVKPEYKINWDNREEVENHIKLVREGKYEEAQSNLYKSRSEGGLGKKQKEEKKKSSTGIKKPKKKKSTFRKGGDNPFLNKNKKNKFGGNNPFL